MTSCPSPPRCFSGKALAAGAAQSHLRHKSVLILWQILTGAFVPRQAHSELPRRPSP